MSSLSRATPNLASTSDATDPLALERQVCFALSIAARNVLSVYRPLLEPLGLTHPQYLVMLALWADAPLSVRELATLLHLDSPTLSPLLKRLEAAGLLTRTREEHNERQLRIELTERGRDMRADAQRIPPAIISLLGIEISDLEDLHASLTSLIDAAHAAGVRPLPEPAPGSV